MAGYAMGFEDGGVEDDSGALPVVGSDQEPDNSGALPVVDDQGQQQQQPDEDAPRGRSGLPAPHQMLRTAGKSILSYLTGAGAAPPEAAQKFAAGVKAEYPGISDDDANVLAVHKAMELGGPDAAWQMVQFNRTAYNAKQSFALAALMGTQGKPADVRAAAQAATQASQHVLDGSRASFTASPDGTVTATVNMPGSNNGVSYKLTPRAFARWLNVGKDGQWDNVMENGGIAGTLSKLSAGDQGQGQDQNQRKPLSETYEDDDTDFPVGQTVYRRGSKQGSNFGSTPSTVDLSSGENEVIRENDDLQTRANRLFPSASQQDQRNAYIAQQMDQAAQGRRQLRQAEARGDAMRDVAGIRGQSQVGAAQARAEGTEHAAATRADASRYGADTRREIAGQTNQTRRDVEGMRSKDREAARVQQDELGRMRERGRNFRSESSNPIAALRKPEEQQQMRERYRPEEAPAPGQQGGVNPSGAQQRGGRSFTGANVPPAAQRLEGDTVTTPKGTFRWSGSGWQKQ